MNYRLRQRKLMQLMAASRLDALVITHGANLRYLCGFTGSAGVLLAQASGWRLYTDGRYRQQAAEQVQGARVVIAKGAVLVEAARPLSKPGVRSIGIESDRMTVAMRSTLLAELPKPARLQETRGMVERLRAIKEPAEIELIRRAVVAGAGLLKPAVKAIRPGTPEVEVAAEIEYAARGAGAEGMSFDTIVASGPRSALPHGVASVQRIPRNGFVVLDFGIVLAGYCSDMTRTVHVGRPGAEMRGMYAAVKEAQQAARAAVRPGIEIGKVDAAARQCLRRSGWARYFTHATGHGVGLEIHEQPRVARGMTDLLQPGMVITIEPGVYVPGKGGVRIEDMMAVTERGAELLTPAPADLVVI